MLTLWFNIYKKLFENIYTKSYLYFHNNEEMNTILEIRNLLMTLTEIFGHASSSKTDDDCGGRMRVAWMRCC